MSGSFGTVGKVAFVFSGHGSQWTGMGRDLLESSEVFRARIRASDQALASHVGWSVEAVLRGEDGAPGLDRVDVVQPVLFSVMVSLAALWRSVGVEPDAVVGHSVGEIAAAHVAGALSLDDAAAVVANRSRVLAALTGRGWLLSLGLSVEEAGRYGVGRDREISLAAVNGSRSLVVAGDPATMAELADMCARDGVHAQRVGIDYAAHSPQVEDVREEMLAALRGTDVSGQSGAIPFYSGIDGELVRPGGLDADYWYRGERQTVRFDRVVHRLLADGHRAFVEVSPHPILSYGMRQICEDAGVQALSVGSLRRGEDGQVVFRRALAELLDAGMEVDQERARDLVDLVCRHTSAVLGDSATEVVDPNRSFVGSGLDSLGAVVLSGQLATAIGTALPSTLVFDHPTPVALARHLHLRELGGLGESAKTGSPPDYGEPIAIVAAGCRYPGGVDSPEALWRLVADGTHVMSDFPKDRGWDLDTLQGDDLDRPGTSYLRTGGFLAGADGFDPGFFGISPREALAMDPQQRVLLEVAWEALERAGIRPDSLRGSRTGVFAGLTDYGYGTRPGLVKDDLEGLFVTGDNISVASGRISYALGLEGPSISVDTACSSSLVAIHLACQSLRLNESSLALAGGVAVMASPWMFIEFSRQRGLAPDGKCKAFSADADGTAWAEGAGMLVLERLSDARRHGHPVLGVIRGSAVNNDGASNGLTAPSGTSQQRVIRQALHAAGLEADQVDAVEAHGTGTRLGDPIEANALLEVYGADRPPNRPLHLGSLKSNIGHAQAAAGVGGVIKMAMAMQHGELPATLHAERSTPQVDWSGGGLRLLTEALPWPRTGRPYRAGVSSFGISGTNAHLVIEQAPARQTTPARGTLPAAPVPCLVSGKSETALRAQAQRLRGYAEAHPDADLADIGFSLATTRSTFENRAVVVARDRDELVRGLDGVASGCETPGLVMGTAAAGRTAFLFAGQGGQRPGMGRGLYETFPVYAAAFDEVCHTLDPHLDRPMRELVFAADGSADPVLDQTTYTQPALFALEVALYQLYRSWGLVPDLLLGHSVGEMAAAHVAGVLSLSDACTLVVARGRLMGALPGGGAMAAVQVSEEEMLPVVENYPGQLEIAAVNGPSSVVVSGDVDAVVAVVDLWKARGRRVKRLRVSHAFHSPRMDPMLDEFQGLAKRLTYREPRTPMVSNVTGAIANPDEISTPEYWVRHARQTVRFHQGMRTLEAAGATIFLELGPDAVLATMGPECVSAKGVFLPALHAGRPDDQTLMSAAAGAFVHGAALDWPRLFDSDAAKRVELPTYPFQRQRFWLEPTTTAYASSGGQHRQPPQDSKVRDRDAADATADDIDEPVTFRQRLAGLSRAERVSILLSLVRSHAATVLGHPSPDMVRADQGLPDLGLDSLAAVTLSSRLGRATGLDARLTATVVFEHPTPTALAEHLAAELVPETGGPPREVLSLRAEIHLPDDVTPQPSQSVPDDPRHILMTGATGFVGAFLLRELLATTRATVHCLVRGADGSDAGNRLRAVMEQYELWDDTKAHRVAVIVGDLAQPMLGLTTEHFDNLARTTDAVYHAGSAVNWIHPYAQLKAANVTGTVEILRLATRHRTIPVHYLSTVAVFADTGPGSRPRVEDDLTGPPERLTHGYPQSKWVAEEILLQARARGLPVSIYRLPRVLGDRRSGACQTNDLLWLITKGCIQVGAVPADPVSDHVIPVDYAATAVVSLAGQTEGRGEVHHLANPHHLAFSTIVEYLTSLGYPLESLSMEKWVDRISADPHNAAFPVLDIYQDIMAGQRISPASFDSRTTTATLAPLGLQPQPITSTVIATYIDYFVRTGYLPRRGQDDETVTPSAHAVPS